MSEAALCSLQRILPEEAEELSEKAIPVLRKVYAHVPSEVLDQFLRESLTPEAIRSQMSDGMVFCHIISGFQRAGFLSYAKERDCMHLSKLYLFEEYRGKGLGRRAFEYVEHEAHVQGCRRMRLEVNDHNERAMRFYEGLGFVMGKRMNLRRFEMTKELESWPIDP